MVLLYEIKNGNNKYQSLLDAIIKELSSDEAKIIKKLYEKNDKMLGSILESSTIDDIEDCIDTLKPLINKMKNKI